MYGLLATLYGPTARFAIRKTYRNRIVAYMDYCSMSILDKPPQIIILTRVSFRSFSYLHQSSFICISGLFNHGTVSFFACQAACLMECMEGGNDASRIEVLKLIILSLMFVFFVYILACFVIVFSVSSFLFYLFVCLCACFRFFFHVSVS